MADRRLGASLPRGALAGLAVIVGFYALALLAPFLTSHDPVTPGDLVADRLLAPSTRHLLGTDHQARDVLTRLLYGARISLSIALLAMGVAATLGTLLGALAGYVGGWVDAVVMRTVDGFLAFPRLVLLITVVAFFRPSVGLLVLVLGLTLWPSTARLVRGEVLSIREREYVVAARALGYSRWRILFRHVVPNALAPAIVAAALGVGDVVVLEAGLSFLGLGVEPSVASWGNMIADGRNVLTRAWWVATFPGLAVVVTVVAFNLLGEGLQEALDPRLRSRS